MRKLILLFILLSSFVHHGLYQVESRAYFSASKFEFFVIPLNLTQGEDVFFPTVADVDNDGVLEIILLSWYGRLFVVDPVDKTYELVLDQLYPGENTFDMPLVADVDNDGHIEIIFTTWEDYLICVDYLDHRIDWIVNLSNIIYEYSSYAQVISSSNYSFFDPIIVNLNDDPYLEIILVGYTNVFCLSGLNGTLLWKKKISKSFFIFSLVNINNSIGIALVDRGHTVLVLDGRNGNVTYRRKVYYPAYCAVAGDVDGDLVSEIVLYCMVPGTGFDYLVILNDTQTLMIKIKGGFVDEMVMGDIDGDYKDEIFFCTWDSRMFAVDNTGKIMWIANVPEPALLYYKPVLADVNGDGILDVIVATPFIFYILNGLNGSLIFALNATELNPPRPFWTSPCVGDFDGDGRVEIAVSLVDRILIIRTMGRAFSWYCYAGDCMGHANSLLLVDPRNFSYMRFPKVESLPFSSALVLLVTIFFAILLISCVIALICKRFERLFCLKHRRQC